MFDVIGVKEDLTSLIGACVFDVIGVKDLTSLIGACVFDVIGVKDLTSLIGGVYVFYVNIA